MSKLSVVHLKLINYIVHENGYNEMNREQLKGMLSKNYKNQTFEEWCSAFCNRKYNSDFAREMTRSVDEYLKQFD